MNCKIIKASRHVSFCQIRVVFTYSFVVLIEKSTISQTNVLERVRKTYFFSFDTTGTNISAQILLNEHHRVDKNNIVIVIHANNMIVINIQVK